MGIDGSPRLHDAQENDSIHKSLLAALNRFPVLFDADWYTASLKDELPEECDPLDHFMRHGRALNKAPGAWLDPQWYWEDNSDVAAAGQPAVDHYFLHGEAEGRLPRPDLVLRLAMLPPLTNPAPLQATARVWAQRDIEGEVVDPQWLIDDVTDVRLIEPQLSKVAPLQLAKSAPHRHYSPLTKRVDRALEAFAPDTFLLLVPHFMLGGADRVAANIATVAAEALGAEKVRVIATDRPQNESASWFPDGVTLTRMVTTKSEIGHHASASRMMAELLMNSRPRTVLNVNSLAGWMAFREYGSTLSDYMSLNVSQFCRDQFPQGGMGGYADDYLRDTIEALDRVLLDHKQFGQDLINDLALLPADAAKLKVVYSPSTTGPRRYDMLVRDTKRVLWVGRLADQKKPDLVARIASLMPDVAFDMYGGPVTPSVVEEYGLDLPNVRLHGPVDSMDALHAPDYGALLFTSGYEGMPVTAVDVGAWGLPIVASRVGGLPELIDDSTGWPVESDASPEAYVAALREALEPAAGQVRGRSLQKRVEQQHSWDKFRQSVLDLRWFD